MILHVIYRACYLVCENSKGCAVGCIEGRVGLEDFDEMQSKAQLGKFATKIGAFPIVLILLNVKSNGPT